MKVSIDDARSVAWDPDFTQALELLRVELEQSCGRNSEPMAEAMLVAAQAVVVAHMVDVEMRLSALEASVRDPEFIARTLAGMSEDEQGRVLVLYDAIKQAGK